MKKITVETALEHIHTPVPELAARKGIGHHYILALCEEYRKILLARMKMAHEGKEGSLK